MTRLILSPTRSFRFLLRSTSLSPAASGSYVLYGAQTLFKAVLPGKLVCLSVRENLSKGLHVSMGFDIIVAERNGTDCSRRRFRARFSGIWHLISDRRPQLRDTDCDVLDLFGLARVGVGVQKSSGGRYIYAEWITGIRPRSDGSSQWLPLQLLVCAVLSSSHPYRMQVQVEPIGK
ncbi:hypothetical protein OF83DRAFT_934385 [Amylostereum chailletii]|nr:hypothetical protein OF83DRAFT_934385 [Amylostereum chailletii]